MSDNKYLTALMAGLGWTLIIGLALLCSPVTPLVCIIGTSVPLGITICSLAGRAIYDLWTPPIDKPLLETLRGLFLKTTKSIIEPLVGLGIICGISVGVAFLGPFGVPAGIGAGGLGAIILAPIIGLLATLLSAPILLVKFAVKPHAYTTSSDSQAQYNSSNNLMQALKEGKPQVDLQAKNNAGESIAMTVKASEKTTVSGSGHSFLTTPNSNSSNLVEQEDRDTSLLR